MKIIFGTSELLIVCGTVLAVTGSVSYSIVAMTIGVIGACLRSAFENQREQRKSAQEVKKKVAMADAETDALIKGLQHFADMYEHGNIGTTRGGGFSGGEYN